MRRRTPWPARAGRTPTAPVTAPPPPPREPADALLRRVYLQRDLTDAIAVLQTGLGELLGGRAVLVLAEGELIETGSPELIFSDPRDPRTRNFLQRYL